MSKRIHILGSVRNIIGGVFGMLGWLLRFARMMLVPKAVLAAKLLAAESQLAAGVDAVDRKKAPKPKFKLTTLRGKLIKIGAKAVHHAGYVVPPLDLRSG